MKAQEKEERTRKHGQPQRRKAYKIKVKAQRQTIRDNLITVSRNMSNQGQTSMRKEE